MQKPMLKWTCEGCDELMPCTAYGVETPGCPYHTEENCDWKCEVATPPKLEEGNSSTSKQQVKSTICPVCKGVGVLGYANNLRCQRCKGTGK